MKKLLAVLVAGLMLGSFAITASAADLANYAADATYSEAVVDEAAGTTVVEIDLNNILPLGYYEITWGDNVPSDFVLATKSQPTDGYADQATVTGNTDAVTVVEVNAGTARLIRLTVTGTGYEVKSIVVRKTKDEVAAEKTAYPSSGVEVPEGSVVIPNTNLVGNETGWGDNANTGRAAAFDGDINTFFDPLGTGNGYCGVDAGKPWVLTKIVIHPRDAQLARYYGATIQGTNTPDDEDSWTDVWMSLDEATEWTWHEVEQDEFDEPGVAYQYYRYYNMLSHGDVAEVELYGYPEDGVFDTVVAETEAPVEETEAPVEETVAETEAPAEETEAPQTFDAGIVAAAAAAVSAIGYAISKKKN